LDAGAAQVLVGTWDVLGNDARQVREAVFVIEQGIARELEWDQWDCLSVHAVARDTHGAAIGTGRLLPAQFDPDNTGVAHIGRMAVLAQARRGGVGGLILASLMNEARRLGFSAIVLNAQTYVATFYAVHGFVAFGPEFLEVDIPHVSMRAPL
jgi:predicted GNAT family N-acyltransferase